MTKPTHQDALLRTSIALPNGAASVVSPAIDIQNSASGDFIANTEIHLTMPTLTVGELANGATMTYEIQDSATADFASPRTLTSLVQTGAGGAGAAIATRRLGLATDTRRYLRVRVTNSAAANASAKSAILALMF